MVRGYRHNVYLCLSVDALELRFDFFGRQLDICKIGKSLVSKNDEADKHF